jgi:hypothetical protein
MGSMVEKCRPLSCIDLIVYSSGRKEGSSQHLSYVVVLTIVTIKNAHY